MKKSELIPIAKMMVVGAAVLFVGAALLAGENRAPAGAETVGAKVESKDAANGGVVRVPASSVTVRAIAPVKYEVSDVVELEAEAEEVVGVGVRNSYVVRRVNPSWNEGAGGIAGDGPCPNPDPDADCFEPHGGVGCNNEDCCLLICGDDPLCCDPDVGWDEVCATSAEQLCSPDCTEAITPGAIYSNWHPDCWDVAVLQGNRVRADNLWWGDTGGLLQEITFAIYNGSGNQNNLTSTTVEVILSTTIPGHEDGTLDLSTAIAIIEVTLENLDLAPTVGMVVSIEPEGGIFLPVPGVNAGTRYMSATFDGEDSNLDNLGSIIANPIALGLSHPRYFVEDTGYGVGLSSGTPGNYLWEIVTDGNVGTRRVMFDNAPQQQVISATTGNPTHLGLSSGILTSGSMAWVTMPFELAPVPEGGDAWRITGFYPHFFVPADALPNLEAVHWMVWERDGDNPPGKMLAQGTVPYPMLEMYHPLNARRANIHPLPVDVILESGEYYLTVHGSGSGPDTNRIAWFTNAANGIKLVDEQGSFFWRQLNPPANWAKVRTSGQPLPDQDDPDTVNSAMFFILGEAADKVPTPCPGDITGSGNVGVPDLLALLSCWGPVHPGCEPADLTNSGNVGVPDLLALLSNWGPCPE